MMPTELLRDAFDGPDQAAWDATKWTTRLAVRAGVYQQGGRGILDGEDAGSAQIIVDALAPLVPEIDLRLQTAAPRNGRLLIRLFPGEEGEIDLLLRSGVITVYRATDPTTALISAGLGARGAEPGGLRLKASLYRGRRDIRLKTWAGTVEAPAWWEYLSWQSEDPALVAAVGGFALEASGRNFFFAFEDVLAVEPDDEIPPAFEVLPYDLAAHGGVFADGRDQHLEIAAAVAQAATQGFPVYCQPGGVYGIQDRTNIEGLRGGFFGRGAEFRRTAEGNRRRGYLHFIGGRELDVGNLRVQGPEEDGRYRTDVEFAGGLTFESSASVRVHDVSIDGVGGDGVRFDVGVQGAILERAMIRRARRQGISAGDVDGLTIRDLPWVEGQDIGRSFIDLEPYVYTREIHDFVVERVKARSFRHAFIAGKGATSARVADCEAVGGGVELGGRGGGMQSGRGILQYADAARAGEPENTPGVFWAYFTWPRQPEATGIDPWILAHSGKWGKPMPARRIWFLSTVATVPNQDAWRTIAGYESPQWIEYDRIDEDTGRIEKRWALRLRLLVDPPFAAVPQSGDLFRYPRPASIVKISGLLLNAGVELTEAMEGGGWDIDANEADIAGCAVARWGLAPWVIRAVRGRLVESVFRARPEHPGLLIDTGGHLGADGQPLEFEVRDCVDGAGNPSKVTYR